MTDPTFERSLRAAARRGRPGGVHPDASLLAAYVDRGLSDAERAALEAHVADCAECMERLALLGSVNVPDEPELPTLDWSPRQLLSRWGWLVPVATVVVLVAVWERQPSRPLPSPTSASAPSAAPAGTPAPSTGAPAAPPASNEREQQAQARKAPVPAFEEPLKSSRVSQDTRARQIAQAPKAKDAAARPEKEARAGEGLRGEVAGGAAQDASSLRDKKETDALSSLQANKVAPAPAPALAPAPVQAEAAASAPRRADEAKPGNQPQAGAVPQMHETVAEGALLKSAVAAPMVLVTRPGVSIRRVGAVLERSTDNGATWNTDLADAPPGLHVGSCPTTTVCWLGGSQGIVLVRQSSGAWTRHVVADGRAAVASIEATDAATATVHLSDGRRFGSTDGGGTWTLIPDEPPR